MLALASYFAYELTRPDERTFTARLPVHDGLRDASGALRLGAVGFVVDVAAGGAMEFAVAQQGMWVVTSDLDVGLVAPVEVGPLRVDAEVLRAGRTRVVSRFVLHDEGTGRVVGGGTATASPRPDEGDVRGTMLPLGGVRRFGADGAPDLTLLWRHLGVRDRPDGGVELDLAGPLRNPWGILHGGVFACLADAAVEQAAASALGDGARARGMLVRYLSPVRVGPARAVPTVLAVEGGAAQLEVRVLDAGDDDRLAALATVDVTTARPEGGGVRSG